MFATSLEGAALLVVDDLDAASLRQRKRLRPAPPASRARLPHHLARRVANARRELRRPPDGMTNTHASTTDYTRLHQTVRGLAFPRIPNDLSQTSFRDSLAENSGCRTWNTRKSQTP